MQKILTSTGQHSLGVSFEQRIDNRKDKNYQVFLKAKGENQNDSKLRQAALDNEISKLLRGSFYKSPPLSKVLSLLEDHQVPQDVKEDSVIQFLRSHWNQPYLLINIMTK